MSKMSFPTPEEFEARIEAISKSKRAVASAATSAGVALDGAPSGVATATNAVADSKEMDGTSRGGFHSKTPLAISKSDLATGGEDTVHLSLFVEWGPNFGETKKTFEALKEAAQENDGAQYFECGGDSWAVGSSGFRMGEQGKKAPMFRWRLSCGGYVVGIQPFERPKEGAAVGNVWLQIGSERLMVQGNATSAYLLLAEKLRGMGGKILMNKVSRMDACVDLPGADIRPFAEAFREHRYICRGKKRAEYEVIQAAVYGDGHQDTGFRLGGGLMVRAYEKKIEVRSNPEKEAILQEFRWGGPVEKAVRVEFELSRKTLKERGVDSLEDWEKQKASIVLYLVGEWFRMTKYPVDRTNTTRAELSDEWQLVKERFLTWAGGTEDTQKAGKRAAKVVVDVGAATLQSRGCLAKIFAVLGMEFQNVAECKEAVLALLFDKWDWKESIAEKRLAFLAAHPGGAFAIVEVSGECS